MKWDGLDSKYDYYGDLLWDRKYPVWYHLFAGFTFFNLYQLIYQIVFLM